MLSRGIKRIGSFSLPAAAVSAPPFAGEAVRSLGGTPCDGWSAMDPLLRPGLVARVVLYRSFATTGQVPADQFLLTSAAFTSATSASFCPCSRLQRKPRCWSVPRLLPVRLCGVRGERPVMGGLLWTRC